MIERAHFPLLLKAASVSVCATTINGRSQKLLITTAPADAVIRIDGVRVHDTHAPEVSRSHNHAVTIEQSGFDPETIAISRD